MENKGKVNFGFIGVVVAIGIVFGDLGTSPLYVMRAVLNSLPGSGLTSPDYIIGVVSCIIWTLTLQTTLKYVMITLRADNKGEGGILALYALIRKKYRWAFFIAAIGAAALLADGVITPAMTIISAVEGLNVLLPSIPVVPVTVAIVIIVFMIQPFGTRLLGRSFGPLMVLWFGMMAVMGAYRLADDFSVLKAFNPYYAVTFIMHVPNAMLILGAVFLCTTGAEALYSDLGHCGLKNIRVSWMFIKLALVLNYLGQAAWILQNPAVVTNDTNPFFMMMPQFFQLPGVLLATVAAIIASQSLISGSFTIISEAISLNLWPNLHIKYPTNIKGQMYIPAVNFALMILCILIIITMRSSMNLEAAYGLAITISMLMTSLLLYLYLSKINIPFYLRVPLSLFFIVIEMGFLIANFHKFSHGGFIPILITGILGFVMFIWYSARRIKRKYTVYDQFDRAYTENILKISEDKSIPKIATHLVYLIKANRVSNIESKITYSLFKKTPKRADTYWFVNIVRTDQPYDFLYDLTVFESGKIFRIDVKVGFKLGFHVNKYVSLITSQLESKGIVDLSSRYSSISDMGYKGDFTYMVVNRTFKNLHLGVWNQFIINAYNVIKNLTTSDVQMYDIDPTLANVEIIPQLADGVKAKAK